MCNYRAELPATCFAAVAQAVIVEKDKLAVTLGQQCSVFTQSINSVLNCLQRVLLLSQAVMVEKNKPAVTPGGMGAGGMPSGMTL
jgi:hypothetical protein